MLVGTSDTKLGLGQHQKQLNNALLESERKELSRNQQLHSLGLAGPDENCIWLMQLLPPAPL
jgi:hypothetical protein